MATRANCHRSPQMMLGRLANLDEVFPCSSRATTEATATFVPFCPGGAHWEPVPI